MARRSKVLTRGMELVSSGVGRKERVIANITGVQGENMVREKRALRIERNGKVIGYQLRSCPRHPRSEPRSSWSAAIPVPDETSSAAFSPVELDRIAGHAFKKGKSRTEGLNDEGRAQRLLNGFSEEDEIEQARKKLEVYPEIH